MKTAFTFINSENFNIFARPDFIGLKIGVGHSCMCPLAEPWMKACVSCNSANHLCVLDRSKILTPKYLGKLYYIHQVEGVSLFAHVLLPYSGATTSSGVQIWGFIEDRIIRSNCVSVKATTLNIYSLRPGRLYTFALDTEIKKKCKK